MTAGSDSSTAVAGGLARHIPVLGRAAVDFLRVRDAGIYVDATFGGGGYSREILAAADCTVIGIDRDPDAIARAAELPQAGSGRLVLAEGRFSELHSVVRNAGHDVVDGVVFDLGLSSLQLDEASRGFSFRLAGPLDMRMGGGGPTAAELLACASEKDLTRILAVLGEERHARRIARAIVAARRSAPLRSTLALAELVARVVPGRPGAIHPATRTFQALRIFVNDELAELAYGLAAAEEVLKAGGRLVVVAFHSLEDRMVKTFFAERAKQAGFSRHRPQAERRVPTFTLLLKRPLVPDDAEITANPRARSAKLRAAERTGAPPLHALSPLPALPSLFEITGHPR